MRFPRTISSRITIGFGILVIVLLLGALLSYRSVSRLQAIQEELHTVIEPSILRLMELQSLVHRSGDITKSWSSTGREDGAPLNKELGTLIHSKIPEVRMQILQLSDSWKPGEREAYANLNNYISDSIEELTLQFTSGIFPDTTEQSQESNADVSPGLPGSFHELVEAYEHTDGKLEILIGEFETLASQANEKAGAAFRETGSTMLIAGILIVLITLLISILLYASLANQIKQYGLAIASMGKGVIPEGALREGTDELGQIGIALNNMIKGLTDLSEFAEEIGKGNFKSGFSPLSDKDILGNSLIRLRESLKNAAIEEEKRKREDERRNWSNQGIARFSEIMREHTGDARTLSDKLISELVKYLGALVGGIFLIRSGETDPGDIELVASYAYDRNKYLKKTIKPGEGLVGRCVQEGKKIFLTDLPDGYIKIKSGLGEDNPKSLLLVPIRFNERIVGVIEVASLEIFQDFQIEFVERIASSIASSLTGEQSRSAGPKAG